MIFNFIKLAFRNLRRQPFFAGVNIVGLGVGLAACWLLGVYVMHERDYDRFLPDADRICAVALDLKMGQDEGRTTNTPPPLGPRLLADFPEIELAARTFYLNESTVRVEKPGQAPLIFSENEVYAADTAFLELFRFPMTQGDMATALDYPGSVVLSELAAARYFGKQDPMGQPIWVNDKLFNVSGVVKALPTTTTVRFDFLLSMADFKVVERFSWSWIWLQVDTWVRLRQAPSKADLAALEAKFPAMVMRHAPKAFERIGQNFEEQLRRGDRWDVHLLPLSTLHLGQADLTTRLFTLGDGNQVRMFGVIGLLILILASVNFMNLSTARSSRRAREVGVRKVLGSQRTLLIGQFLAEALLFSVLGMGLAMGLASLLLPLFNQLAELELTMADLFTARNLGVAVALTALTGLLGGLYPAFFLSGFKTSAILKTAVGNAAGGHAGIRNGLVVFQFSVSIALMLFAWAVMQQLEYGRNHSPGLNRENVLVLPVLRNMMNQGDEAGKMEVFRQQIERLPEVASVSNAVFLPSQGSFSDFYEPEQGIQTNPVPANLPISSFLGDTRLVPTLGLEIVEGRNFQDDTGLGDSCSVILNEAAVRAIGWEKPIGQWMRYPGNQNQRFQVVGVMRDFHLGSIRGAIEPAALFHQSSKTYSVWAKYVVARIRPGAEKTALDKTARLWAEAMPQAPFNYDFLDVSFARLYRSEAKLAAILSAFTLLTLFIGCLGLFALAAFMAERRTKEIGIRKVLGASVASVVGLLSKDFLKLVLIAIVIASPIAYYFMQRWLADFAYRIEMKWWMFAAAGAVAVLIAFLTVGAQSVRAALANPVKSLRSE
jgi:putative ABC transport system permease protein